MNFISRKIDFQLVFVPIYSSYDFQLCHKTISTNEVYIKGRPQII